VGERQTSSPLIILGSLPFARDASRHDDDNVEVIRRENPPTR
jgi:hypothetical protein